MTNGLLLVARLILSATFNAAGQISSRTQSNDAFAFTGHQNVDRTYVANGLNQYLSAGPATFTYDANGNLTSDGASTWVYDVENRLVSARGLYAANLRYDPLGRLHETVTGVDDAIPANDVTVRRLYDGGALVAEYDQTGALLRRFVHGPNTGADTPLVWYEGPTMQQSAARMLNTDLQGSVTSVTDFNGAPVAINRYDEYGRPQSGNTGRFQYTGQAWLPEIGLYYYKARMYSPTLGRFMQTDPIGYADGLNWYNYVGGDPVNGVDPSGLCHTELWGTFTRTTWSDGNVTTHLDGLTTKTIGCEAEFGAIYRTAFGDGGSNQIVVTANNAKPNPCASPLIANALADADVQRAIRKSIRLGRTTPAIYGDRSPGRVPIPSGGGYQTEWGFFAGRVAPPFKIRATSPQTDYSTRTVTFSNGHRVGTLSGQVWFHYHPNGSPLSDQDKLTADAFGIGIVAFDNQGRVSCYVP